MHKLLEIQLKKCFGKEWGNSSTDPQFQKFLNLINESYQDFDDHSAILHRFLEVNSKELTEAIKEIKKGHDLLHSVTESIHDLIFYKDLNFKYIGCNQSFANFFGKSEAEFLGQDDFDLYPMEYALGFRQRDTLIFSNVVSTTNEEWVKNSKGDDVLLLTTKHPLFNSGGELMGLVGIARNITKEYWLEQEVREQQAILTQQSRLAALGEMIGNIAHQWRQPINSLGLIIQDLNEAYRFGELNQSYVQTISSKAMEQIHYMSNTIDDFRNFFNPDKDKKIFSLNKSIENTKNILKQGIKNSSIECEILIPKDIFIYGYKNEFSQVIFNLLSNARDAIMSNKPKTPKIKIHVKNKKNSAEISVSDNGGGIPPDILPSIFDPYFTTKPEGKGTGIGLYMAKKIIENHMDGLLLVHNTKDGVCFTIVLPIEKKSTS